MSSDRLELTRTIEARVVADADLAATLVRSPRRTIEPGRAASERGIAALDALRKLGASTEGRIALHHTLGEGGMGVVHLATQSTMGRHVAVKTRRAEADHLDATLRILREAWVTGALEHPNVVPVYDVGVDATGAPVIVMKRIEGRAWADLMAAPEEIASRFGATDPLEWNLRILMSACNAVHFAHSRGILHRDLKPDNVMIGEFGEVYVLDWGIAVSLEPDPSGRLPAVADATDIVGTPAYMAPEMLMGDPSLLSPATDVYLLGAILYEIFAGEPPHDGPTVHAMISSVLLSEPAYAAGFPAEARAICVRAMSRAPGDRHPSAEALRLEIEAYLRHRGSRRIASEARQSLDRLLHTLEHEPAGEERALAVFNLLGECRFGYRSALSAWPENERARQGLDQALLAVVDHELAAGNPGAAASLLREVSAPPADLGARVEAAVRARADEDERLRRLDRDGDATVGSRTRAVFGAVFGAIWVAFPIAGWLAVLAGRARARTPSTWPPRRASSLLALAFFYWARDSLTKTRLNRRISVSFLLSVAAQVVIAAGTWAAGLSPEVALAEMVLSWCLLQMMLGGVGRALVRPARGGLRRVVPRGQPAPALDVPPDGPRQPLPDRRARARVVPQARRRPHPRAPRRAAAARAQVAGRREPPRTPRRRERRAPGALTGGYPASSAHVPARHTPGCRVSAPATGKQLALCPGGVVRGTWTHPVRPTQKPGSSSSAVQW